MKTIILPLLLSGALAHDYLPLKSTAHFEILRRDDVSISDENLGILVTTLERGYQEVSDFLYLNSFVPRKFRVLLDGEGLRDGEMPNYPSVDSDAVIRLYHFPGPGSEYLQALPHEIVHAVRNDLRVHHEELGDYLKGYGFIEEGFAEYVAAKLEPTNESFPRYGFPLPVVTAYWLKSGRDIPLQVLLEHHEINGQCVAQAYPLRASFFTFLEEKFGKQKVLDLAYIEEAFSITVFDRIFGKSFSELSADWKVWAMEQFEAYPEHEQVLNSYEKDTFIKYFPVCSKGKNWD